MKAIARITAAGLAALLCLSTIVLFPVSAEDLPLGESPSSIEDVPETLVYDARIDFPDAAYFLEAFGDARSLTLEDTAYAQYSRFGLVECEIVWRYDAFDNHTPGRRMIVGDIVLPTGYAFQSETLTVQSPVIVYDPDGPPTETLATCVYSMMDKPILIPLGAGRETLPGYFADLMDEAILITESGDEFFCPVTLDLDAIDTSKEGVYYPIVLDLPGGVTFGGQEFYMTGVHVIPDDEIDLSTVKWWRYGYIITWLYPASEPILWASVDAGDWFMPEIWAEGTCNEYGFFNYIDEDHFNELLLVYNNLPTGHVYKFQIQYDGDRFSNVVEFDLINNSLPKNYFDTGGDRNGGDRGENDPPPTTSTGGETPATPETGNPDDETSATPATGSPGKRTPTTPATGSSGRETPQPAPIQSAASAEHVDDRSVTVSGALLAAMMVANPEYVSFFRGELRASIPTAFLESLEIAPSDYFTVMLYKPREMAFSVSFAVNDSELSGRFSQPFLVSLTWNGGSLSCGGADGENADAALDVQASRATFALYKTGTYTMTEQAVTALSVIQDTAAPNTVPTHTSPVDAASEQPYADDWAPALTVGFLGVAGSGTFLGLKRIRLVKRP